MLQSGRYQAMQRVVLFVATLLPPWRLFILYMVVSLSNSDLVAERFIDAAIRMNASAVHMIVEDARVVGGFVSGRMCLEDPLAPALARSDHASHGRWQSRGQRGRHAVMCQLHRDVGDIEAQGQVWQHPEDVVDFFNAVFDEKWALFETPLVDRSLSFCCATLCILGMIASIACEATVYTLGTRLKRAAVVFILLVGAELLVSFRLILLVRSGATVGAMMERQVLRGNDGGAGLIGTILSGRGISTAYIGCFLVGKVFGAVSDPLAWGKLNHVAILGGRRSELVVFFALATISLVIQMWTDAVPAEFWIVYALSLLMATVLCLDLAFAAMRVTDVRLMLMAMDRLSGTWSILSSPRIASEEDKEFFHHTMPQMLCAIFSCILDIQLATSVFILTLNSGVPLRAFVAHTLCFFLLCPWPEVRLVPCNGGADGGALLQRALVFSRHVVARFAMEKQALYRYILVAATSREWQWDVVDAVAFPLKLVGWVSPTGPYQQQRVRAYSPGHGHKFLVMLSRDIEAQISAPLPPVDAHLFPVRKCLDMLTESLNGHPLRKLVRPQDILACNALGHAVHQASQQTALRLAVLQNAQWHSLLDAVLCDLRVQMVSGTILTAHQRAYTLAPCSMVDPPIGGVVDLELLFPGGAQRRHLECITNLLHVLSSCLLNPKTSDPDDLGLLELRRCGALRTVAVPLLRHLPLLLDLAVWCEGPGEAYAAPALTAQLQPNGVLQLDDLRSDDPIRLGWISVRGVAAECASKLLSLVRALEDDHASSNGRDVMVDVYTTSGFAEGTKHFSEWWGEKRAQTYFVRVVYALQKRYFRNDVHFVAAGQFVELMGALFKETLRGSASTPAVVNITQVAFVEDENKFGLCVRGVDLSTPVSSGDHRFPLALQTCNNKPVLLFVALILLRGLSEMPDVFAPNGGNRTTVFAVAMYRFASVVNLLAKSHAPFATDGLVPLLVRMLRRAKAGVEGVRSHIRKTFFTARFGGVFGGDLHFIEDYYRCVIGCGIVGAKIVASIVEALHHYMTFVPTSVLRLEISNLMQIAPLEQGALRPFVDEDDIIDDAQEDGAAPSNSSACLYAFHLMQIEMWTATIRRYWGHVAIQQHADEMTRAVHRFGDLCALVINVFQFPPSIRRMTSQQSDRECNDDEDRMRAECVICLEPLHAHHAAPSSTDVVEQTLTGLVEVLGCHHKFHAHCFFHWFCGDHKECPLCRQPFVD